MEGRQWYYGMRKVRDGRRGWRRDYGELSILWTMAIRVADSSEARV